MHARYNTMHGTEHPLGEAWVFSELRRVEMSVVRDRNPEALYVRSSAASSTKIRLYKTVERKLQRDTVSLPEGALRR